MAKKKSMKMSADDDLNGLSQLAGVKKKSPARKTTEKPVLKVSHEVEEKVKRWIPRKILFDAIKKQEERAKAEMQPELRSLYLDLLWENKNQPDNPRVVIYNEDGQVDMDMIFIVQDRFTFSVPEIDDDTQNVAKQQKAALVELLVTGGLSVSNAKNLVENEIICRDPELSIPLTSLLKGFQDGKKFEESNEVQKSAAEKLLATLSRGVPLKLSDEERGSLLIRTPVKPVVKSGLMERLAAYADTREDLDVILDVFTPVLSSSSTDFGKSDEPAVKRARLTEMASKILDLTIT